MIVRWHRVLIYSLAGLCSGLLLFSWNERSIQGFHLDILRNDLGHQARMMEPLFGLNESTSDQQLDAIREQLPYHLTIVDRSGKVVADSLFSGTDLAKMRNQLNHKEIVEAVQRGMGSDLRYSEATAGWVLLAAIQSSGGGFIRLSRPVSGPEPTEDSL